MNIDWDEQHDIIEKIEKNAAGNHFHIERAAEACWQILIRAEHGKIIEDVASELEKEWTLATFSALIADRGEAITGAIALHRNWAIVIDDKRARRLFQQNASQLQLIYTLELVKHWVELDSPSIDVLTTTLQNIRHRATYTPRRQEPLYDWWHQHNGG